ncbi:acyl-CoA hydrolase [Citricoccus sp. SGAir0253]|uniref:acyl-CoA thioesterase n=1 Tax=Citricoccus sp. SGAir0253 TaxID=2567881 RepID=UPI0010CCD1A5|nr:hotdog domain-containing protein [Citricoccus sp. SGAir0253]QCU79101.1 acyl-CoA hydrolase [Citricoccus sp. SGAir0253]
MPRSSIALQFRAEAYDHPDGSVDAGTVMTWIDKTAYAAAASWSGADVVASYVGNMHFSHPVPVETRVIVQARVVHTGRTSVHVQTRVVLPESKDADGRSLVSTECVMVYVAVDAGGTPVPVRRWEPSTEEDREHERMAMARQSIRREMEEALVEAPFLGEMTAETVVLRFIASTREVYPGEKVQGGVVMRWIDEAADVCASRWSGLPVVAVFAGGVRFYQPVRVGDLVELEAQLVHTSARSMHVSVRARAGDRREREPRLIAHGLSVMVSTGPDGRAVPVRQWRAATEQDRVLERRALELVGLRNKAAHEWAGRTQA